VLRHLHIRNLAVIEASSIEFGAGLNVLTGSTGAGKSIVVDSMALLSGGRGRSELIRSGEDLLTVTGVFDPVDSAALMVLEAAGVPADGAEVVIRREISREDRNRVFVNDRPVTLRLLTDLAPFLLRIHTQREELGLVSPELQRFWVDRSGGREAAALLEATGRRYAAWEALDRRWQRLAGDERLRLERIDLLRFQLREIDAAGLARGEDEELRVKRDLLRHREAIQQAIGASFERLTESDGCAVDALARSERDVSGIRDWEPEAAEWTAELEAARIRVEEVAKSLAARLESLPDDVGELDAIEGRLATIDRLRRKYGASADEILDQRDRIATELGELEASEEDREALAREREKELAAFVSAARELSRARVRWGRELAAGIERELADLALARARLSVEVGSVAREGSPLVVDSGPIEFGPEGIDRVVILLQANPGEASGPLARVASGGELSRVYLALQLAAGESAAARPTLIFDEVDAGIGGSEAAALGRKLRRLSEGGQILAVTHLPQVASCGHAHYRVAKSLDGERTRVAVERLAPDERRREIARMLSGDEITPTALSNAGELLEAAGTPT
jgi:DNA repair protein RecN (Recombination protein N)